MLPYCGSHGFLLSVHLHMLHPCTHHIHMHTHKYAHLHAHTCTHTHTHTPAHTCTTHTCTHTHTHTHTHLHTHTGSCTTQLENKVVRSNEMFPQLLQEERGEKWASERSSLSQYMYYITLINLSYMLQSHVETGSYSVTKRIWAPPLTEVQQYNALKAAMWSKYTTEKPSISTRDYHMCYT